MNKNEKHYPLDVAMPQHCAYAVRDLPQATVEQRERALNATHWNEFAFPSGMLTVDMLSDSGTTAMTNQQLGYPVPRRRGLWPQHRLLRSARHLPRHLRARRREELEEDHRPRSHRLP